MKQRTYKLQILMRIILFDSALDGDYKLLRKMVEVCGISKRQLVEKAKEKRFAAAAPAETIYMDMIQVLYDEAVKDPSILDLFYENCKEMFPGQYNKYLRIKALYDKHANWVDYYNDNVNKDHGILHFFLWYEGNVKHSVLEFNLNHIIEKDDEWLKSWSVRRISDIYEGTAVFNTGENILSSLQYEKYLKKKRGELAEYANEFFHVDHLTEENIGDFIQEHLIPKVVPGARVGLPPDNSFISMQDAIQIVVNQNGGPEWLPSMTLDNDLEYIASSHYKPDVDGLINIHYQNCVIKDFLACKSNDEEFTKGHLVRDCNVFGIEEDFNAILYMYQMDVFCKMFNQLKDEYYMNFSWEGTDNRENEARYESRCEEMQDTINALNQKLEDEKHKRITIKEEADKSKKSEINKHTLEHRKEIAAINKELKEKDKEIAELKKQNADLKEQNAAKDEHIEILSAEEAPDIEEEVDITSLQQKRYLFVGRLDRLPELKHTFPDSVFMDTEQKSLDGIKVDAIVLLTKYMSHKMFYKVKNTASLADLQPIHCNATSLNSIYKEMASVAA